MYGCSVRDQEDVSLARYLFDIHAFDRPLILAPDTPAIEISLDDCSSEMAIEQRSSTDEN